VSSLNRINVAIAAITVLACATALPKGNDDWKILGREQVK
jgi:hypothetical protein